jgi:hypothetical protein
MLAAAGGLLQVGSELRRASEWTTSVVEGTTVRRAVQGRAPTRQAPTSALRRHGYPTGIAAPASRPSRFAAGTVQPIVIRNLEDPCCTDSTCLS